jgi:hypothetical protein
MLMPVSPVLAPNGHGRMSDLSPLSGEERKSNFGTGPLMTQSGHSEASRDCAGLPLLTSSPSSRKSKFESRFWTITRQTRTVLPLPQRAKRRLDRAVPASLALIAAPLGRRSSLASSTLGRYSLHRRRHLDDQLLFRGTGNRNLQRGWIPTPMVIASHHCCLARVKTTLDEGELRLGLI